MTKILLVVAAVMMLAACDRTVGFAPGKTGYLPDRWYSSDKYQSVGDLTVDPGLPGPWR